MARLKCKKEYCEKPAAKGHVYCSREHAPYGYYCLAVDQPKRVQKDKSKRVEAYLRLASKQGLTLRSVADELEMSYAATSYYVKMFEIKLKKDLTGRCKEKLNKNKVNGTKREKK